MDRKWIGSLAVILFFGALWGLVEVLVGGAIYAADLRGVASPVLAILAFAILAAARTRLDVPGSSTAIGLMAMIYKGLVATFVCHLMAIALLGVAFDLAWSATRGRRPWLAGVLGCYLGFALFAVTITWVVGYHWWAVEGLPKVAYHVLVSGSIAAAASALIVPAVVRSMGRLQFRRAHALAWGSAGALLLWAGALVHGLF